MLFHRGTRAFSSKSSNGAIDSSRLRLPTRRAESTRSVVDAAAFAACVLERIAPSPLRGIFIESVLPDPPAFSHHVQHLFRLVDGTTEPLHHVYARVTASANLDSARERSVFRFRLPIRSFGYTRTFTRADASGRSERHWNRIGRVKS